MYNYTIEDIKALKAKNLKSKYCFEYHPWGSRNFYTANSIEDIRKKAMKASEMHYGPQLRIHIYTTKGTRVGIIAKDHGMYEWWKQNRSTYYMSFDQWVLKADGTLGKSLGNWEYLPDEVRRLGL